MTKPDDWHLHLRDGAMLQAVVGETARRFGRAIVMPNLVPPVTTTDAALAYRRRVLEALAQAQARAPTARQASPQGASKASGFEPLMTLYLTDRTPAAEIEAARASGCVHAVKWYPAGVTTHSESGVTDIRRCEATLAAMEAAQMPLLVHGEVADPEVDVFDREAVFIERELAPLLARFPRLKLVLEHVTTQEAVAFVRQAPPRVAATITAHHLLLNRNALLSGGLRPHHYCLPVVKRERHREALVAAATSGDPKFFLGTDSAPHRRREKESDCGCAGIYTAHAAIELYAEVFEAAGALDRLEAFASFHGADFYGLPRNRERITLERAEWAVPAAIGVEGDGAGGEGGDQAIVPFRAGQRVGWRLAEGSG